MGDREIDTSTWSDRKVDLEREREREREGGEDRERDLLG